MKTDKEQLNITVAYLQLINAAIGHISSISVKFPDICHCESQRVGMKIPITTAR
jgi:hypothetical protein